MSILYIVATPIGNLEDISPRALRILQNVDFVLCEDTRVTNKIISAYKIKASILNYHHHSNLKKIDQIIKLIREGKNLALVSDAGTPGISDPGGKLIERIFSEFGDSVKIIPIPGPSAVMAAASISGFPMERFVFLGFPPSKKKRQKFFKEVSESIYPVIIYESPHRIIKTLEDILSQNSLKEVVVCREMTKKFETIYRGQISEVLEKVKNDKIKGEFTVIIKNN